MKYVAIHPVIFAALVLLSLTLSTLNIYQSYVIRQQREVIREFMGMPLPDQKVKPNGQWLERDMRRGAHNT